jgi:hypothetical protein
LPAVRHNRMRNQFSSPTTITAENLHSFPVWICEHPVRADASASVICPCSTVCCRCTSASERNRQPSQQEADHNWLFRHNRPPCEQCLRCRASFFIRMPCGRTLGSSVPPRFFIVLLQVSVVSFLLCCAACHRQFFDPAENAVIEMNGTPIAEPPDIVHT